MSNMGEQVCVLSIIERTEVERVIMSHMRLLLAAFRRQIVAVQVADARFCSVFTVVKWFY
jgi:hypothetical protein